ncbi:MAG TPA: hypothetical protein VK893_14535 [Pyrinomonadaceae bacterium]|nr:hypothetical protein [Pyrinomonadaceae bacterium]
MLFSGTAGVSPAWLEFRASRAVQAKRLPSPKSGFTTYDTTGRA